METRRARSAAGPWWPAILLLAASCDNPLAKPKALDPVQVPERDDTAERLDALRRRNATLEREVRDLRKQIASSTPEASQPAAPPAAAPPIPAPSQSANPWTVAKPWVEDVTQLQDAEKRDAAIETIRRAVAADAPEQVVAGLVAIPQIAQVSYDKAAMRELVLRHAKSPDDSVRAAFPFALLNAGGPQPGDVDIVLPLTSDAVPSVRGSSGRSLTFFTKGDLTGRTGERVLALLNDTDRQVRRDVLGSVWGARVSPEIEAKLLADFASPDPETRRQAFYFGLSTLRSKSPAVVDACIAAMESNDRELQQRARWGLLRGVPDELRGKVGDSYLRLLNLRADAQLEQDAFEYLRLNGNVPHATGLENLAENRLLTDSARRGARDAANAIRARELR